MAAIAVACSGGGVGSPMVTKGQSSGEGLQAIVAVSTPTPAPTKSPAPSPSPTASANPLIVSPATLAFTAAGQSQTFSAQEMSYTNTYSATSSSTGVATVTSRSYGSFTVTSIAAGTTTITVTDLSGHSATVTVNVGTTSGTIN